MQANQSVGRPLKETRGSCCFLWDGFIQSCKVKLQINSWIAQIQYTAHQVCAKPRCHGQRLKKENIRTLQVDYQLHTEKTLTMNCGTTDAIYFKLVLLIEKTQKWSTFWMSYIRTLAWHLKTQQGGPESPFFFNLYVDLVM